MKPLSSARLSPTGRAAHRLVSLAAATALIAFAAFGPTAAKSLRFASAFDPQSMDPHALALLYQSRVVSQVYDSLVNRDREFRLEPSLALSWQMVDPRTWRFRLRPNVRFHDGAAMTADDVVFSIERAMAKSSQRAFQLRGVTGARRVDALTVDVLLEAPDAVLPEKLVFIGIMSRAWAERHGVTLPQDFNAKQETHAVRNANGTGPFVLRRYEPDTRLVLEANPNWWGRGTSAAGGNVTEAVYTVIQSDATRMAALATGEADFVIDPPFQDVARLQQDSRLKFATTTDIGTQYLGFDQARAELETGDVKGRNPFRDLRVRKAVYHAIDIDTIIAKVLRGQAMPTGSFVSRLVVGYRPELERRLPYDPAAARALLKDAGYPGGFSVQLDCVNVTFRAAVCQAIAAMLAQVGIRTTFQPSPSPLFFPKLTQATSSFFEFGWSPTTDAWSMLNSTVRSYDGAGAGAFNGGRYSNPKLDALIDGIRVEPDVDRRRQLVGEALQLMADDLPLVPLYRRRINWVMRPNIHPVPWPNDILELRFVRID
jgi:peptide/nickel transport system substrate-binding protein